MTHPFLTPSDPRSPAICACGEHGFVGLTRGAVALFSPEDMPIIAGRKWACAPRGRKFYAMGAKPAVYMHRAIMPGVPEVDHIRDDGLDNRRCNLRPCTRSQNVANTFVPKGRTSRFKGVHRNQYGTWTVQVRFGVKRHIGNFDSETRAAVAYDDAARRAYGEFARTNESLGLLTAAEIRAARKDVAPEADAEISAA